MSARPIAVPVDDMNAHANIGFDDEPGARPDVELNSRVEAMTGRLSVLTKQNSQLLTSVSHLLDLYEAEKAQRLALQASMERLVEDLSAARPETAPENTADEIRRGVSEDLRPLLHAIIDLVEISMRRTPTAIAEVPRPSSGQSGAREESLQPHAAGEDNLPQALPEILTKSVEELIATARGGRQENSVGVGGTVAPGQESATVEQKNGRHGGRRSVLPETIRAGAWIPVTSDKAQT
jgi:hypothetical protein